MLKAGQADAAALSRESLAGLVARVPGSRVLDGSFHSTAVAVAVPKGRPAALAYVTDYVERALASGAVQRALDDAGIEGRAAAIARTWRPEHDLTASRTCSGRQRPSAIATRRSTWRTWRQSPAPGRTGRRGPRRLPGGAHVSMVTSVLMMCFGSLLVAVLPTYATIGPAAPLLLVTARLIQGFPWAASTAPARPT